MPTGYTADLYDGEQTFEDFVWRAVRAMGALILMRDEPLDVRVPERFEPSSYHAERLAKARARLAELDNMTSAEVTATRTQQNAELLQDYAAEKARIEARCVRVRDMYNRVTSWEPPTPEHAGFKAFMLEQLEISLQHDCHRPPEPSLVLTNTDWMIAERASAERDVKYHTKEHAAEVERTELRNAWIAALRESVPQP